jgi:hypothetical protein
MRCVKIVQQPNKTYPYAAVDQQTGGVVLRHHDEVALIGLCRRLEWNVDDAEQEREMRAGRPAAQGSGYRSAAAYRPTGGPRAFS